MDIEAHMERERQDYAALFMFLGIDPGDVGREDIYLRQQYDLLADETYYVLSFQVFKYNADGHKYVDDGDYVARVAISLRVPFNVIEEWRTATVR